MQALCERGLDAHSLPLIEITPAPDHQALERQRTRLGDYTAVMFVSANAVEGLIAAGVSWPATTRAWATGPGTRDALLAARVPRALIDAPAVDAAQFDSESLWAQVRPQATSAARVLIARGADALGLPAGRNWLADQLVAAGARVDTVATYARGLPVWDASQTALAQAAARGQGWWVLSSSEAVDNLRQLLPAEDFCAARALCSHPRIAQAARAAGFGVVAQTRPVLESVAGFLQSQA